ncbi:MAG: aconitate hydratase AcnA [Thermoanaerobaculia bacterium]|nr:aconitate hydratase AcnA [Thermoanaerobaculia bacterium]
MQDSFSTLRHLQVGDHRVKFASLPALENQGFDVFRLPFATRILLENLLRREDGDTVPAADVEAVANWDPQAQPSVEIAFMPGRVLLQDFTGVPAIVDLAAMRDAMVSMGGTPNKINPLQPAELVIDHSVQVDEYGSDAALLINAEREFERNFERYAFLRWGQGAFENFKVVPPATGIVHQVNLEYLARVVMTGQSVGGEPPFVYPDTLVGTDSHTTMINGLGVLGWGVGGIEAEAAMLGQPISMLIPQVVGFKLVGELGPGATATDLVLRVVEMLRAKGVVGKFVEFFGPGLGKLPLADRATIANMAPEYGATCGIFPIDSQTLDYLRFTGRDEQQLQLVEHYAKEQGLFHTDATPEATYSDTLELDLSTVQPSLAGPKRPQDRIELSRVKDSFLGALDSLKGVGKREQSSAGGTQVEEKTTVEVTRDGETFEIDHGSVVIAAITSCTNTSNPSVMVAAGLLARKARQKGLTSRPWVKTSLAPGSKVVTRYLDEAGLTEDLEALKFHTVGYGCTTCIGNSGPVPKEISEAIHEHGLVATSVLSGNRNFEGRISPDVRANYLASPPLVVAYALAGRIDIDFGSEPLGQDQDGRDVFLKDVWPSREEVQQTIGRALRAEMFSEEYADVFHGTEQWRELPTPAGDTFEWRDDSTYVRLPPFFTDMPREPETPRDVVGARVLALLGHSVTTDHISPAGAIKLKSPAGEYLTQHGVHVRNFNSYGSRRGNHEVMMRGTFANVRLRNKLVPHIEGGYTRHLPDGEEMSIYDAAMKYQSQGTPLVVIAGKEYGTGSSRDWAAKGTLLLGVRAVIAESYERIHRSNLIGMGVLPLEFESGEGGEGLGLSGTEVYSISGIEAYMGKPFESGATVDVRAEGDDGAKEFRARIRLDTPQERAYYLHGGILQYVLRQLL